MLHLSAPFRSGFTAGKAFCSIPALLLPPARQKRSAQIAINRPEARLYVNAGSIEQHPHTFT